MILKNTQKIYLNKYVLTAFLLFVQSIIFAQTNMIGDWKIDKILGLGDFTEYSIVRQDDGSPWGNVLTLNLDGTFLCGNKAPCGNDTFRYVYGDFIKIGNSHIRFIVRKKSESSFNKATKSESGLNIDLGVFYIYEDSKSVRLIPSNGDLQQDKDEMLYAQMLESFGKEWRSYDFVWENTDGNQPDEIVNNCKDKIKRIDLSNYKIVSSKNESYGDIFLLRDNQNYHYVVYNAVSKKVSLAYPKNKI